MRDAVAFWELTREVPDMRDHQQRMSALMAQMATASIRVMGIRVLSAAKGKGMALDVERKDFAETLAAIAADYIIGELFRRRVTGVAETTRNQIVNAVARGYEDGLAQDGIGKYILDQVPTFSTYRANMIARTETHGAANAGSLGAAKETGIELRKEWLAAEDERTRPDHKQAGEDYAVDATPGPIGFDEPFMVGGYAMQYPGDPSGPAHQVINCRCTVAYIPVD
jgi:uncharacterized protein with gpF-like domain